METWTEGDRARRMKLDAGPWTREKWLRKGSKHVLWFTALWTGFTFVGFFTPIRDLGARLVPFDWGGWETFWVLFYAFATWGQCRRAAQQQVCKYMCPYARFPGRDVRSRHPDYAYDPMRGEPRGSRKRGLGSVLARGRALLSLEAAERWLLQARLRPSAADARVEARRTTGEFDAAAEARSVAGTDQVELGDCTDCTLCVQVCPTGIDIRNGLQYECAMPAAPASMPAIRSWTSSEYPRGLIRYTTQNALDGKRSRVLRPRIWVYGLLLLALLLGRDPSRRPDRRGAARSQCVVSGGRRRRDREWLHAQAGEQARRDAAFPHQPAGSRAGALARWHV